LWSNTFNGFLCHIKMNYETYWNNNLYNLNKTTFISLLSEILWHPAKLIFSKQPKTLFLHQILSMSFISKGQLSYFIIFIYIQKKNSFFSSFLFKIVKKSNRFSNPCFTKTTFIQVFLISKNESFKKTEIYEQ